ncbi:DUF2080 family transposase-associated protein [Methanobrevibacter filiformis]|uniref:AP2 domain protein n=1 Tax=Methanobrevibacter filiformis TaxID=55758 RepID=A0A166CJ71_9EURY|nr:DUF2080 family transposase-associated protein [Methanobrevibacter filiformis]KZX14569.1 AP2 domain protein [Methanobrevibacter filiformis]
MSTSEHKNVYYNKKTNKWVAILTKKEKIIFKEHFKTENDAYLAVEEKKKELESNKDTSLIRTVKPFGGAGAHVNLPKKLIGKTVRIIIEE